MGLCVRANNQNMAVCGLKSQTGTNNSILVATGHKQLTIWHLRELIWSYVPFSSLRMCTKRKKVTSHFTMYTQGGNVYEKLFL